MRIINHQLLTNANEKVARKQIWGDVVCRSCNSKFAKVIAKIIAIVFLTHTVYFYNQCAKSNCQLIIGIVIPKTNIGLCRRMLNKLWISRGKSFYSLKLVETELCLFRQKDLCRGATPFFHSHKLTFPCLFLLYSRPQRVGALSVDVRLSVHWLIISWEWKGIASWKLTERKRSWHVWTVAQFRDQKVKGQGQQVAHSDRKSAISSEREGLGTWNLIHNGARRPALSARWPPSWKLWVTVQVTLAGGGGILWRPHYRQHSLFGLASAVVINGEQSSYLYITVIQWENFLSWPSRCN